MRLKKYILTAGFSSLLLLSACSGNEENSADSSEEADNRINELQDDLAAAESENEQLQEEISQLEEQLEAQEINQTENDDSESTNETSDIQAGSRSEPLALGETGTIEIRTYADDEDMTEITGLAEITVDNVIRGDEAVSILTGEYSEPEEPAEGMEWVVFDAQFILTELSDDDEVISFSDDFEIVTEDGSTVEKVYTSFDDDFFIQDVYSGGSAEGKIAVQAPAGESFIIKYDDYMGAKAFYQVD
ncbi:bZIP transcription factor [Corticicoccus populi]|uniref:BZIP transcription factor n=1 Tax=Corticicoccus populi TaxID=1812821 RepID=A0ABW5WTT9_9STAP